SIAVQLARRAGARVVGTGRAGGRDIALGLGADAYVDLETERLEDAGEVDVVLDVFGGEILERSAGLIRPGGTLVTIAEPTEARPRDGRTIFFVVEADRVRLAELAELVRAGSLRVLVGSRYPLADAATAFSAGRGGGKTIIVVDEH
ncbi:MAG TPA: zinc-binding dehydrogenase, partial [Lentzea sp.]